MSVRALPHPRPFTSAVQDLGSLRSPACLLDHEGVILFVNDAWERLAEQSGAAERCGSAWVVGTRWLDGIHGEEPRRVHAALLHRALRREGSGPGGAVVHTSECNDPSTARLVATRLAPVVVSPGTLFGIAVVHSVARELPASAVYAPVEGSAASYRSATGELVQCGCCRRTRRPGAEEEWDFVPALLAAPPPGARFAYCALCLELHCGGVSSAVDDLTS